jgi:hypothetical protein
MSIPVLQEVGRVLQKGVIKRDHAIMESDEESRGRERKEVRRGGGCW